PDLEAVDRERIATPEHRNREDGGRTAGAQHVKSKPCNGPRDAEDHQPRPPADPVRKVADRPLAGGTAENCQGHEHRDLGYGEACAAAVKWGECPECAVCHAIEEAAGNSCR